MNFLVLIAIWKLLPTSKGKPFDFPLDSVLSH